MQGLLIINLGTPKSPRVPDVRHYLREFLFDPKVIDLPTIPRWVLVNLIIATFRSPKSAHAYKSIWMDSGTPDGSPLMHYSKACCEELQKQLSGSGWRVALGMRYGNPSIAEAITQLRDCEKITILPMFPQYAEATTGSALLAAKKIWQKHWHPNQVTIIKDFYDHPGFISAWSEMLKLSLDKQPDAHVLMSFHGLPWRQVRRNSFCTGCVDDLPCKQVENKFVHSKNRWCYRAQCYATAHAIAKQCGLTEAQYSVSFQSRLGRIPWIGPYTDNQLDNLAAQGHKKLIVLTPSFTVDCLETLEEMGMQARDQWLQLIANNEKQKSVYAEATESIDAAEAANTMESSTKSKVNVPDHTEYNKNYFSLLPCLNSQTDWIMRVLNLNS